MACFADLVYPIQALSHYYMACGSEEALTTARRCAERMVSLQGPAGQWWWHYDVRTGEVIERYPVYAVHQDAMAPMALFALEQAMGNAESTGGRDARPTLTQDVAAGGSPAVVPARPFAQAASDGLAWLYAAPELDGGSLIDERVPAIWRKVARREPGRLVRSIRAGATRVHPTLRLPVADRLFPPGRIDYETRPYCMGWLLYAWRGKQ